MTVVGLVLAAAGYIAAGYVAGRLHGKAAHHQFLARGFRLMAAAARRDGVHSRDVYDMVARPIDVSNAFGQQEDIDAEVKAADAVRNVTVEINVIDRASPAFKAVADRMRKHGA